MVKLSKISKSFNGKAVLKSIDLVIPEGQIVGLVGNNGVGKTTLLNIIAGYLKPDSGMLFYDGGNNWTFMPDVPSFFECLTCLEYLSFLNKGTVNKDQLIHYLNDFNIEYNRVIKSLSRGNRQKLALACCLYSNPNLVILDEPFSALDPNGKLQMIKILNKYITKTKIIILSSHSLEDISMYCKRVILLKDGVIAEDVNLQKDSSKFSYTKFKFVDVDYKDPFLSKYGYFRNSYYYIDDNLVLPNEKKELIKNILSSDNYNVVEFYQNKTEIGRMFDNEQN